VAGASRVGLYVVGGAMAVLHAAPGLPLPRKSLRGAGSNQAAQVCWEAPLKRATQP
jgi:hypothetical protein